jgi:hypothetical protein
VPLGFPEDTSKHQICFDLKEVDMCTLNRMARSNEDKDVAGYRLYSTHMCNSEVSVFPDTDLIFLNIHPHLLINTVEVSPNFNVLIWI